MSADGSHILARQAGLELKVAHIQSGLISLLCLRSKMAEIGRSVNRLHPTFKLEHLNGCFAADSRP